MALRSLTLAAAAVLLLIPTSSAASIPVAVTSTVVVPSRSGPSADPRTMTARNVGAETSGEAADQSADARGTAERAAAVTAPSARFAWPVDPHSVLKRFDPPEVRWGSGHRGVDLSASDRAPIHAPSNGLVTFSGTVAGRGVLTLHHPEGFDTTYEPVEEQLPRGSVVHRGDVVAHLAPGPWHCSTPCLHWGYRVAKGEYRDPLTLVGTRRPVLLPPV